MSESMSAISPSSLTLAEIEARFLPDPNLDRSAAAEAERIRKTAVAAEVYSILARLITDLPGVTSIEVCGYTPSFNDGDPCKHCQMDPNVNGVDSDEYGNRSYYSRLGQEVSSYSPDMVDDHTYGRIRAITYGMVDMFEDAFDTDFGVTVSRDADGNFTHRVDHYDCGY